MVAAACAGVLFAFVFFKNAWLSDDAWITARQVEQLFAGNGLRWNPHERIQLFTSVAGFFLTGFGRLLTADYFVNFAVQAIVLNGAVLALSARLLETPLKWTAAVLLLTASNSYMDFTWSGLHNPLGHAVLIGFLIFWKQFQGEKGDSPGKALLALAALAGLAPIVRHDFSLIVWPPLLYALWVTRRSCPWTVPARAMLLLLLPLAAWTAFSLLYFGFPLPMTAYNKLGGGLSQAAALQNGLHYYLFTLSNDAPVLPIVFAALVWLASRNGASRALASGAILHLLYTLYTGADYMGGRFFTYPYLLAVIVIVDRWEEITTAIRSRLAGRASARPSRGVGPRPRGEASPSPPPLAWWQSPFGPAVFAVIWMVGLPHTPLTSPPSYHKADPVEAGGIADERAAYHRGTSVANYIAFRRGAVDIYPDHPSARLGKIVARSRARVIHLCDMGMAPFFARTDQRLIDIYGYSDVLQARLPGGLNTRPAHIIRRLPDGYLESIAAGEARLADERLNRYYERLRLVTQSENLLAADRLRALLTVNLQRPPTAHIKWPPISGELRLPLLCYAKHDPDTLAYLRKNMEKLTAAELNRSSLSPSTGW
ncbi:MAG: hypothetical protein OXU42_14600 [Deltaproteobacteria bacterium]|nr:hypothetical protein [Deltaproteobacteria bacterium]